MLVSDIAIFYYKMRTYKEESFLHSTLNKHYDKPKQQKEEISEITQEETFDFNRMIPINAPIFGNSVSLSRFSRFIYLSFKVGLEIY